MNGKYQPSEDELQRGRKFQLEGNIPEAIAVYRQLIELDPNFAPAHHFLGECYASQNLLPQAIAAYQRAIFLEPDNPWSHHCLSLVLAWQGKTEAAIVSSRRSIALESRSAFYLQLAQCLQDLYPTEAISAYHTAWMLDPALPEAAYTRFIELLNFQGERERALSVCLQAVARYPQAAGFHYQLGKAYAVRRQWQEAILALERAIEFESDLWQAYQDLEDALFQLGRDRDAERVDRLAVEKFFQTEEYDESNLPENFDWRIYLALNPELNFSSKFEAIAHLLDYGLAENKLYALKHLHEPSKRPDIAPQSLIPSQNLITPTEPQKLAVLVHIYYFDLWGAICDCLKNIPGEFDLWINIVATVWLPEMQPEIWADFPQAKIIVSPNRGKDLGGHLSLMSHLNFANYSLFCLLHTKKSPHIDPIISDIWRSDLLNALLGSREKALSNLAIMKRHGEIGVLGSRYWRSTDIGDNLDNYQKLLDRLDIKPAARVCEYLSGTMMLVRPQILRRLYNLFLSSELESGDNRGLDFHIDGQLAHAIERIIGNLVRDENLSFFWQE